MERVIIKYQVKDDNQNIFYKTIGKYDKINDHIELEFNEKTDYPSIIKLKIYNNQIHLQKNGKEKMEFIFQKDVWTKAKLITDFAYQMEFKCWTSEIIHNQNNIYIKYYLDIDDENNHTIEIEYQFKKNK